MSFNIFCFYINCETSNLSHFSLLLPWAYLVIERYNLISVIYENLKKLKIKSLDLTNSLNLQLINQNALLNKKQLFKSLSNNVLCNFGYNYMF